MVAAQNQFHVKIHIIEGVLISVQRSHRDHTIASTHNSYRLFILNHLVYIVRVNSNAGHWFMSCSFSAFSAFHPQIVVIPFTLIVILSY